MSLLSKLPILIETISRDEDVVAMYLFGSQATGKPTPLSDIDLAILLDQTVPQQNYFNKKLALLTTATSLLQKEEIDLVILNQAPPSLTYRVLSKGHLLYENPRKIKQRIGFQTRALNLYFDFLPVEKKLYAGLINRLRRGEYGGR
ncbi:MAG: type VII toxin-antitoxin system MntA family adenylyltransferase antitoxin [Desulfurispora sp.]|uniref:type VII toxin-antitoxin system MntA family adenylyltransferase antitoxin n=1 Tax=Desulfurispora sp. TaxID=3014275 RepID=UPI00404B62B3